MTRAGQELEGEHRHSLQRPTAWLPQPSLSTYLSGSCSSHRLTAVQKNLRLMAAEQCMSRAAVHIITSAGGGLAGCESRVLDGQGGVK
jgi:hypothetical protein